MEHKEKQTVEQDVITNIICDSCGESCRSEYGFEHMKLEAYWGFDSNKDMEHWEANLCEKCVDEKLQFIKFLKSSSFSGKKLNK